MPHGPLRWLPLALAASGCVVVYHPMSGLHRPVVVDPRAPNLEGLRLTVHCVPGDLLGHDQASVLCQRVGTLFENQGAAVETFTSGRGVFDDSAADLAVGPAGPAGEEDGADDGPPDLIVELRARHLRQSNDGISWALCVLTFTLVPAITEQTFGQSVTIRDGSGFLLATESLEGRIVRRFGAGTWVGNKLLDLVWRDEHEELTGDVIDRDLSADLYAQLSQQVFDASRRREVLLRATSASTGGAAGPPPGDPAGTGARPWR